MSVLFVMLPATGSTQSATDRDAVLKVVQTFFDTMTAKDVEGARNIMTAEGRFYAMDVREPERGPQSFTGEEYFARLQKQTQRHRARIWNPEVRVREAIATVWAPYDVWIDGKFSHCGVDAFDLIKTPEGWKIAGGAFTMEAKSKPSPLGPLKPERSIRSSSPSAQPARAVNRSRSPRRRSLSPRRHARNTRPRRSVQVHRNSCVGCVSGSLTRVVRAPLKSGSGCELRRPLLVSCVCRRSHSSPFHIRRRSGFGSDANRWLARLASGQRACGCAHLAQPVFTLARPAGQSS